MKKIFLLAFIAMACAGNSRAFAQDDEGGSRRPKLADMETIQKVDLYGCSEAEFDWSQYDEKAGKAMLTKKGLELESKEDGVWAMTFCELDNFNPKSQDFIIRYVMEPNDISDDKPFGIVYDVEDEENFRMVIVYKKNFRVCRVVNGHIYKGRSKLYKPGKEKKMEIDLVRDRGKLYVFINGLELFDTKSPVIEHPTLGFVLPTKGKMLCEGIGFKRFASVNSEDSEY